MCSCFVEDHLGFPMGNKITEVNSGNIPANFPFFNGSVVSQLIEPTWYMNDHWVSDCCSMPSEIFFRYIIMRQLYSDEMLMLSALY
jgi:hypothetical protein